MRNCVRVVAILAAAGTIAACQNNQDGRPILGEATGSMEASGPSLYERLGGEEGIRAVVDDLTDRAAQNPQVNFARHGMPNQWQATSDNVDHFKRAMTDFLVEKSGGPERYTGMDMKSGHRGMRISHSEFNALLADADAALRANNVGDAERTGVLKLLERFRDEIVEVR